MSSKAYHKQVAEHIDTWYLEKEEKEVKTTDKSTLQKKDFVRLFESMFCEQSGKRKKHALIVNRKNASDESKLRKQVNFSSWW